MKNGKAPAFMFYAADFLTDTAEWTNREVGVFLRLLLYEWINASLPSDPARLARLVSVSREDFAPIWETLESKFIPENSGRPERLINARLELERIGQLQRREARRKAGSKGGRVAKELRSKATSKATSGASSKNVAKESVNRKEKKKEKELLRARFERIWAPYPRKVAKKRALEVFERIAPDEETTDLMVRVITAQARSPDWKKEGGRFIPYLEKWLRSERWTDEILLEADDYELPDELEGDHLGELRLALLRDILGADPAPDRRSAMLTFKEECEKRKILFAVEIFNLTFRELERREKENNADGN